MRYERKEYQQKRMDQVSCDRISDRDAGVNLLFPDNHELFPAGGGNQLRAERYHHHQGKRNRYGGKYGSLQCDCEGNPEGIRRGCQSG